MKPDSTKKKNQHWQQRKNAPKATNPLEETCSNHYKLSKRSDGQRLNCELIDGMLNGTIFEIGLRWNSNEANRPRPIVIYDRRARRIETTRRLGPPLGEELQILAPVMTIQRGVRI